MAARMLTLDDARIYLSLPLSMGGLIVSSICACQHIRDTFLISAVVAEGQVVIVELLLLAGAEIDDTERVIDSHSKGQGTGYRAQYFSFPYRTIKSYHIISYHTYISSS